MRKLISVLVLACVGIVLHAQMSTVAATVKDSDNQTWNNGTFQVTFVPPIGYQGTVYTFNGIGWTPIVHNGTLSNVGVLSAPGIERNDFIVPAGSHWQFKICPNASVKCTSVTTVNVNQPSLDITSQLQLQVVRFAASNAANGSFGYDDVEVSPVPPPSGYYFNVNLNATRVWSGTQWTTGAGSGGSVSGTPGQVTLVAPDAKSLVGANMLPLANSQKIPALMSDLCTGGVATGNGLIYNGTNWACGALAPVLPLTGDVQGFAATNTVTKIQNGAIPVTKTIVGTNASGQLIDASAVTLNNNTNGNAATATTAATATHAQNIPADFATQSVAAPAAGTFTATSANANTTLFVKAPPYNAKCDVRVGANTMTITGTTTSAAIFTSADVGKMIIGSTQTYSSWYKGKIVSVTGSNATLDTSVAGTVALYYNWVGTDDQSAATNGGIGTGIQGAFTDGLAGSANPICTAAGCSIEFPAGRCLTSTIVWKGQTFFGHGRKTTYVRGMPGVDVFQVPNTTGTWPLNQTAIRDMTVEIDASVNASASANKVTGATVASAGSGGTNGTQTVTGTTGIGVKYQAVVMISSGAISAVNSISVQGYYTTNPSASDPVTGAGLVGASLNLTLVAAGGNNTYPDRIVGTVQGIDIVARDGVTNGTTTVTSATIGFTVNGAATLNLQITYADNTTEIIPIISSTNTSALLARAPVQSQTGVTFTILKAFNVPIAPGPAVFGIAPCSGAGATATAGSTTVNLNCGLPFSMDLLIDPALVIGSPITIVGAGASGGTYNSTVTGFNAATCDGHHATGCTLTVADPIGTAVTNVAGSYLQTQTPPWFIGNAGLALQCSNAAACYQSAYGLTLQNMEFTQVNVGYLYVNHSAGIFTQMPLYAARITNLHFWGLYGGLIESVPLTNVTVSTADTCTFKDMDFSQVLLPLTTYNGNNRVLSDINIYQETPLTMGPFFLTKNQTTAPGNAIWKIDSLYEEGGPATSGEYSRFMSGPYHITGFGIGANSILSWIEFNAGGGSILSSGVIAGGTLHFDVSSWNMIHMMNQVPVTDNGLGNRIEADFVSSASYTGHSWYFNNVKPPRSSVGLIDGSFLLSGNSTTPYLNASDLITTCEDWPIVFNTGGSGGAAGTCVNDTNGTELTRQYYHSNGPVTVLSLANNNPSVPAATWAGVPRTLGTNFPQSRVIFYVVARCVGAATCTGTFRVRDTTLNTFFTPSLAMSLTSSWTTQSVVVDLTSSTYGDILDFRIDGMVNTGTNWDLAYVAAQPIPADFTLKGTANLTTAAIAAGQCGTTVTVPATGVTALNTIHYSYAAVVTANPGTLIVNAWPTVNNVNFNFCNGTAASVTPSSAVLNWEVRK